MRYVLTVLGILVVIGALVAIKGAQIAKLIGFGKQMQASGPPPEAVSTAMSTEQDWEDLISSVGSVATARGVSLSSEVSGTVTRILFESGATVKQGQVLVELDTSVERAQLASAVSRRELAITTAGRSRQLVQTGAIAPSMLDSDESALRASTTDAEAIQAQIARKTIRAPFAGKLGIRAVNLGQYLNPGTAITNIETAEAVHVDFTVPQQRLGELANGMTARIQLDNADAGAVINGKIGAIDPAIDSITRTVRLRADITDGLEQLRPGMFVNVSIVLPKKNHVTTVPVTALIHATYGDSVFVVEDPKADAGAPARPGKIARQQFVRTGENRGDFVSILDGIKANQEVVTAGAFKLRNNSPVTVDNSKKAIDPKLAPTPENR